MVVTGNKIRFLALEKTEDNDTGYSEYRSYILSLRMEDIRGIMRDLDYKLRGYDDISVIITPFGNFNVRESYEELENIYNSL